MHYDKTIKHAATTLAAMFALTLAPSALAQSPDAGGSLVRPSSRATFAAFAIGPSFGLTGCNDNGCSGAGNLSQVKLAQEIGYHLSGDGSGFAIGASLEESFGDNLVRLQPGAKIWWDIQPSQDLALYIAPTLKLGYALFQLDAGGFGSATEHAFNAQVGVAGRLVLGDRGMIFFRPVTLDTFVTDDGLLLTYDVMIGGALTF